MQTKKQIAKKGKALCLYVTLFTNYPSILPQPGYNSTEQNRNRFKLN